MRLRAGTAVLRRGPGAVRIGGDPDSGVLLTGLDEAEVLALESLARAGAPDAHGSSASPPRTARPLIGARIIARLRAASLLDSPAPPAHLHVLGPDPLALAALDALSGLRPLVVDVGETRTDRLLADEFGAEWFGAPLAAALERRFRARGAPVRFERVLVPDLVLVGAERSQDPAASRGLLIEDTVHLPLTRLESGYEIGPLVLPGRTPCATCLALARAEADPFSAAALFSAASPRPPIPRAALAYALPLVLDALETGLGAVDAAHEEAGAPRVPSSGRVRSRSGSRGRERLLTPVPWIGRARGVGAIARVDSSGRMRVESLRAHEDCGCCARRFA